MALLRMRIALAVVVALTLAVACAPKSTDEADAPAGNEALEALRVQLNEALEAEEFPLAQSLAKQGLQLIADDEAKAPDFLEPLAYSLLRQEKFDASAARYGELFEIWDASGIPEEVRYTHLPAYFEYASLLQKLGRDDEAEAILKRATLMSQNLVRRVSGYYLQQPMQQTGGAAFARYLSSGLLELARLYVSQERYEEANATASRAVWTIERLFALNPASVAEVRAYYEELAKSFPDGVGRRELGPRVPAFQEMPAVAWMDEPLELEETDLLLWDKLWYEGQVAEGGGKFETALARYERTLEVARANLKAGGEDRQPLLLSLGACGRLLQRLDRVDEAAATYAESIEVRRTLEEEQLIAGLLEAGAFYLSAQKTQEAGAALEEALPLVQKVYGNTNTNYALLRTLMASAALQRGDAAGAIELYDRYLIGLELIFGATNPWVVMLYNDYALALERMKRTEQLVQLQAYLRAMENASLYEPARIALVACRARLQKDRNVEAATECFDKALAVSPVFPSGYRLAGSSLLWFADANEEAIGYFEKALSQYAFYPVVYNEMAYAYIGLDNPQAAMDVAQMQIQLAPGDANAYDTLGDVYKAQDDLEKAIDSYRTACALGMQASCERRELQE